MAVVLDLCSSALGWVCPHDAAGDAQGKVVEVALPYLPVAGKPRLPLRGLRSGPVRFIGTVVPQVPGPPLPPADTHGLLLRCRHHYGPIRNPLITALREV